MGAAEGSEVGALDGDNEGEEVRRFNFYGAYPVSLSGPELSSESSAVAIEKFEIAVDFTDWG